MKMTWAKEGEMNDTHPKIKQILDERYAALAPEVRLEMGCSMFESCPLTYFKKSR